MSASGFSSSSESKKQEVGPNAIDPGEHIHLARWFVGRWLRPRSRSAHLFDDLLGAAYLGLCEAARTYDPARGAKWSVWAAVWMRREVIRAWNTLHDHVHVTRNARQQNVPSPIVLEIDAPYRGDGETTRLDRLPAPGDVEALLDCARHVERLHATIETLPPRARCAIALRFGLDGEDPLTLREVGAVLGLGRERVRQIEGEALCELGRGLARRGTTKKRRNSLASHRGSR